MSSSSWKSVLKISSVTGAGIFGWYAGKHYEQYSNYNKGRHGVVYYHDIKRLPGLPIFGTVSAATPFDPNAEMGTKLSVNESRVSQVSIKKRIFLHRHAFSRKHHFFLASINRSSAHPQSHIFHKCQNKVNTNLSVAHIVVLFADYEIWISWIGPRQVVR